MTTDAPIPAPARPAPARLALSVLDLIPVRSTQSSADAVAASITLARRADELGYTRYWVAEHHNMPAVASTAPAVLIGILASHTERIRVGAGGVMLPNHSPLVVAEQFAALEAAFPGRIDLGIGRAPGSDPVITSFLRMSGTTSDVDQFPQYVQDIGALLDPQGASLRLPSGERYSLSATPKAASTPPIWLLGSSDYSARLAASLGLPYVFAHHFSGEDSQRILGLYRDRFEPAEAGDAPRTFLTVNMSVAETVAEARAAALPQLQRMAQRHSGSPQANEPLATIEEAAATELTPRQQQIADGMAARWVIDTPDRAAERIRALAASYGVDEVMLVPWMSAPAAEDPATSVARVRSLELLAAELL